MSKIHILYWLIFLVVKKVTAPPPGINCDGDCLHISQCGYFTPTILQYERPKFCDQGSFIVCCPKKVVQLNRNGYYKDTESRVFQKNCQSYYRDVYKTCKPQPLVIGGTNADLDEFPFMALIARRNPFNAICGGTLLSPKFVLTAAHCNFGNVNGDMVRLGELDYSTTEDRDQHMDFDIKSFTCHPAYDIDDADKQNDIALVELTTEAPFSEHIAPACLPLSNGTNFNELIIAGWGSNKTATAGVSHLQKAFVNRYDDDQCAHEFLMNSKNLRTSTQICAISNKSDTCNGDSGGPLFVNHPDYPCMYIVLGITSFGFSCGVPDVPAAYTRVNLYISWIEHIVWKVSDSSFAG